MKKYISLDAIVTEIERIKKEECPIDSYEGRCKLLWFEQFLSFLDTLETKEEILDKEGKTKLMKKCVHKAYKRGYDMGVLQATIKMIHNTKDVDLNKEIKNAINEYYNECEKKLQEMPDNDTDMSFLQLDKFAKHFYELGQKTKGE